MTTFHNSASPFNNSLLPILTNKRIDHVYIGNVENYFTNSKNKP